MLTPNQFKIIRPQRCDFLNFYVGAYPFAPVESGVFKLVAKVSIGERRGSPGCQWVVSSHGPRQQPVQEGHLGLGHESRPRRGPACRMRIPTADNRITRLGDSDSVSESGPARLGRAAFGQRAGHQQSPRCIICIIMHIIDPHINCIFFSYFFFIFFAYFFCILCIRVYKFCIFLCISFCIICA